MASSLQPADMLALRIIEVLMADTILSDPATGLLFPDYAPQLGATDVRVYTSGVELPEGSEIREALPRILVATLQYPSGLEQQGDVLEAPVAAFIHVLAVKEDEERCARIEARTAMLLLSTQLSDVRIIAAGLVADGTRTKGRIAALNDAWEIVSRYRSANVGVLT